MERILVTNDDGFESPGIRALVRVFRKEAEVLLVAPKEERSCSSHSITARHPLHVQEVEVEGVRGYAVDGTPADAVILGLNLFRDIGFVISGINRGPNLGFDVFYSGTVAAGLEAAMSGIPSLAVSLVFNGCGNYTLAAEVAVEVWKTFKDILQGERNLVLNVNVPDVATREALRGLSVTELGDRFFVTGVREVERREEERVFIFEEIQKDPLFLENSDFQAVWENRVSVTPLRPNLTDYLVRRRLMEMLKR